MVLCLCQRVTVPPSHQLMSRYGEVDLPQKQHHAKRTHDGTQLPEPCNSHSQMHTQENDTRYFEDQAWTLPELSAPWPSTWNQTHEGKQYFASSLRKLQ